MNSKICIILTSNLNVAPFYKKYENIIKDCNRNFDLIYWDRSNLKEDCLAIKKHSFKLKDKINSGNYLKFIKYYLFYKFVKKQLKKTKYDKIIILGSYAFLAFFVSNFLIRNYYKKYIFDIRDYTYEKNRIYYNKIQEIIDGSYKTIISSEKFKDFLPNRNYLISHNLNKININLIKNMENFKKIKISFIGLIRYFEENIKILNILGNDNRFIIQYYGQNSEILEKYCKENNIYNVDFFGKFDVSETIKFYNNTNLINNIYGSTYEVKTALSNKLYYSISLKIPILVSPNTFISEIVNNYKIGLTIDLMKTNLNDEIFDYYTNIDKKEFEINCNKLLDKINIEDQNYEKCIKDFITS